MNKCKTCEHWDRYPNGASFVLPGTGQCIAARQLFDVSELDDTSPDDALRLLPAHAGILCAVEDGSQYMARLITMPDFGCVMHQLKE